MILSPYTALIREAVRIKGDDVMNQLRQEVLNYIGALPDAKLEALRPLLRLLVSKDRLTIETNLTEGEKIIIMKGRKEYAEHPESFTPLEAIE
jgi:hypothetical protein